MSEPIMSISAQFLFALPYANDLLALPVTDLEEASNWYSKHFGLIETSRSDQPTATIIMRRDHVEMGFAINGGNPEIEGAAILVDDIELTKSELENSGLSLGNCQTDERDGKKFRAFFVAAPDGLCYYFHQEIEIV